MNYYVLQHSASSLKPRLKFWKYNPTTKTVYFTATTKDGDRQYPIGISKLQDMNPGNIKQALMNSLAKFGVVHDDQLVKAVNEVLSMSHSEEMEVIDVSDEVLEHANRDKSDTAKRPSIFFKGLIWQQTSNRNGIPYKGAGLSFMTNKQAEAFSNGNSTVTESIGPFMYPVNNIPSRPQLGIELRKYILANCLNTGTVISTEETNKAIDTFYNYLIKNKVADDHGIVKRKIVRHSLFTEVYDMDDYLEHHGILGMKWGVRRYQNEDGSLTEAGRKRYINKKYKQSRTNFEKELNEKLEGKSREEQTKIIRQESRDLAEAAANRANTNTKKTVGTAVVGGTAGGVAGGLLAGPFGAVFGAYMGSVVSAVGSSLAIELGEQFLYSERNRAKDNLLNMKYDEINIDEETKRRLNL